MSGKQTGAHTFAQCEVWLNVIGYLWPPPPRQVPLEWFPYDMPHPASGSATPNPGLGAAMFDRGRVLLGLTYPPVPTD